MNTFAQADTNNTGAIEKPEWDALLLDDKRRRIEDDDAHSCLLYTSPSPRD